MGLFEKLFPREAVNTITAGYLQTLTGYQPIFNSFKAGIYESELCRASIHAIAEHSAKLKPVVKGTRQDLKMILEYQPNPWMDTYKFLYKLRTILETENTAFIVPMYDQYFQKIVGFYPIQPSMAEVREKNGIAYLVFTFPAVGKKGAIELANVGILNKFFYKHEFFGENNGALRDTIDLIYTQKQGITEGIKSSATVRFIGKLAQALKPSDIDAERERWKKSNLAIGNNGGIALFDTKYDSVQQIDSKPYIIEPTQIAEVKKNVFDYFNVNEKILQNDFSGDEWSAFYEGKIEPFALQLSMVLTNMLFTNEQKVRGNSIMFSSNRLQYMTPTEKLQVVSALSDRGMMNRNEGREVFNMDSLGEEGEEYIIRGEYYNANEKVNDTGE